MKMKITIISAFALCVCLTANANLIISEGFDYTLGSTSMDADGGLNGGNGLPATNVGGNPAGTGTGLRNNWNGEAVAGLTYSGLQTSANAMQAPSGFGARTYVYRNMTTDPFLSLRQGGVAANFGNDGDTLWLSFLMNTSAVGDGIRSSMRISDGSTDIAIGVNSVAVSGSSSDKFTMDLGSLGVATGSNTSSVAAAADTTYLVVGSIAFQSGGDAMDWWINPTIGGTLGTADISLTTTSSMGGINNFNSRVDGATAVFDEIRMGTSFADVTPVPEPGAYALLAGVFGLALVTLRRRRS